MKELVVDIGDDRIYPLLVPIMFYLFMMDKTIDVISEFCITVGPLKRLTGSDDDAIFVLDISNNIVITTIITTSAASHLSSTTSTNTSFIDK